MDTQQVGIIGAVVALFLGGAAWSMAADRQRTDALRAFARRMGFDFTVDLAPSEVSRLAGTLPLFQHGHSHKTKRALHGQIGGRDAWLLDYRYTTGSGKNSTTHHQTVALFPGGLELPSFDLSPENFLHRVASVFGYQDIDFDSNAEFSSAYLLRGPDEFAIRAHFRSALLAFFAHNTGWHVEVQDGRLAVFRAGSYISVKGLDAHLRDVDRLVDLLTRR